MGSIGCKERIVRRNGNESDEWIKFGAFRTDVNRGMGFCHTFLARKAIQIDKLQKYADETEEMEIKYVSLQQLMKYYKQGMFKEAKWSNTVGLSLMWMLTNTQIAQEQSSNTQN